MKTHTIHAFRKTPLLKMLEINLAQRGLKNKIIQLRHLKRLAFILFILSTGCIAVQDGQFPRSSTGLSHRLSKPNVRGSGVQSNG